MRFYELFARYNTLFNPSDTVIKCFSRCTHISIAISVITRTGYNEQIRLDLGARYIRFLLYYGEMNIRQKKKKQRGQEDIPTSPIV